MAKIKTIDELEGRLGDCEGLALEEFGKTAAHYRLEAGKLRKAIARRKQLIADYTAGRTHYFTKTDIKILMAEAEYRAQGGKDAGLWAGVAFNLQSLTPVR